MRDYLRVKKAIEFITAQKGRNIPLEEAAAAGGLGMHHFQRMFSRWAGVSPKRFIQSIQIQNIRGQLRESESVFAASLDAGLSSAGRMHDLCVTVDAVTPGEYSSGGEGLTIEYGMHPTPFGYAFLAHTARGVCALSFHDEKRESDPLAELLKQWPAATIRKSQAATKKAVTLIFEKPLDERPPLHLYVKGTNWQLKVWEALLRIPYGSLVTYGQVASTLGKPNAARAAGNAIAANPIAFLIPCHRVIRQSGVINNYRWGTARKQTMIGFEAVKTARDPR